MQPTHGSKLENATFAEVTSSTKLQMSFSSYLYCTFILSSYLSKTKLFFEIFIRTHFNICIEGLLSVRFVAVVSGCGKTWGVTEVSRCLCGKYMIKSI